MVWFILGLFTNSSMQVLQLSPQLTSISWWSVQQHHVWLLRIVPRLHHGDSWPWHYCHMVINPRALFRDIIFFNPFVLHPVKVWNGPDLISRENSAKKMQQLLLMRRVKPKWDCIAKSCYFPLTAVTLPALVTEINFPAHPSGKCPVRPAVWLMFASLQTLPWDRLQTDKLWPSCPAKADTKGLIHSKYGGPSITHGFDFHKYWDCSLH